MITQVVYLPSYDWEIIVLYCQSGYDEEVIVAALKSSGCADDVVDSIRGLIADGEPNTGFTYTNGATRTSIVALGPAESPREFQNTLDHEKSHVVSHIASVYDINSLSEEYQYLAGDLGEKLLEVARFYLCDACQFK